MDPGYPAYEEDTIYTKEADEIGDFKTDPYLVLEFSFYAEDVKPLSALLYLHSDYSTSRWEYAFDSMVGDTGTWATITIPFVYSDSWLGPAGASEFLADLADIDWIGVNLARKLDTIEQVYGIDDWEYYLIPEPGTVCALASVFISLALTFRKRLRGKGAG